MSIWPWPLTIWYWQVLIIFHTNIPFTVQDLDIFTKFEDNQNGSANARGENIKVLKL
jgi:hypothetical protein